MKATKLVALGLVSMTVLATTGSVTFAANKVIDSTTTGKVTFSTKQDETTVNPGGDGNFNPDQKPGGNSNTTDPDLQISYVPNFVFGNYVEKDGTKVFSEKVNYDKTKGTKLDVMKQKGDILDNDGNVIEKNAELDNFAQIMNTDQIKSWAFTVSASEFSTGSKAQPKMVMTLNNVVAGDKKVSTNLYGTPATVTGESVKKLEPGQEVAIGSFNDTNADGPQGALNIFNFSGKTAGESGVTLDVPKGLSIENDEVYTSTLTWTVTGTVN